MKKKILIKTYSDRRGDLSFVQNTKKFKFSRIYYIHNIKKKTIRGEHYHKKNRQLIICIKGQVELRIIDLKKNKQTKLTLDDPKVGTFIENFQWHSMCCSKNSIILVLAEKTFSKKDYFKI
jgi:dTDP-4-dehydrorhamnose 3,5-epimerase-like enzyme